VVNVIANHSRVITIRPPNGEWNPKNTMDHNVLSVNCRANAVNAGFTFWLYCLLFQTRDNAAPIIVNKVIQTGAKTQLGGVNEGLFRLAYHVGMEGVVKKAPMKPAVWHSIMLASRLVIKVFRVVVMGCNQFK